MRKICLVSFLFSVYCSLHAQDNTNGGLGDRKMIDRVTGNLLYVYQYEDVNGSSFLYDNWLPGTVILNNHAIFNNVKLKFDVKDNEFVFNRNDSSFQLGQEVVEVRLYPKNGDSLIFKNGYDINNAIRPSKYLLVLAEGKLTFLKYLKKNIEEYNEYGDATKYKRFTEMYDYYIYKDGKAGMVHLNKKELQNQLSDQWDKMSQYMSQNNLSGKDEKSFIGAIRYYNSL
jgi:hypothetical protein